MVIPPLPDTHVHIEPSHLPSHVNQPATFNLAHRNLSRSLPSDLFGYDSFPCTVYRGLMELRK